MPSTYFREPWRAIDPKPSRPDFLPDDPEPMLRATVNGETWLSNGHWLLQRKVLPPAWADRWDELWKRRDLRARPPAGDFPRELPAKHVLKVLREAMPKGESVPLLHKIAAGESESWRGGRAWQSAGAPKVFASTRPNDPTAGASVWAVRYWTAIESWGLLFARSARRSKSAAVVLRVRSEREQAAKPGLYEVVGALMPLRPDLRVEVGEIRGALGRAPAPAPARQPRAPRKRKAQPKAPRKRKAQPAPKAAGKDRLRRLAERNLPGFPWQAVDGLAAELVATRRLSEREAHVLQSWAVRLGRRALPQPAKHEHREPWLHQAAGVMAEWINALEPKHPIDLKALRVSCSWPLNKRATSVIGQCVYGVLWQDGHAQVFVSPMLSATPYGERGDKDMSQAVLDVLAHELVHVACQDCAHGPEFRQIAVACGMGGKMTATVPTPQLQAVLDWISVRLLGPYPHSEAKRELLDAPGPLPGPGPKRGPRVTGGPRKQATRQRKWTCSECGAIIRAATTELQALHAPTAAGEQGSVSWTKAHRAPFKLAD